MGQARHGQSMPAWQRPGRYLKMASINIPSKNHSDSVEKLLYEAEADVK